MYGYDMGTLRVLYANTGINAFYGIWGRQGNQGNQWNQGAVQVPLGDNNQVTH